MVGVTGAKLLASSLALWLTYDAKILSIKMPRILFPLHTGEVQLQVSRRKISQKTNYVVIFLAWTKLCANECNIFFIHMFSVEILNTPSNHVFKVAIEAHEFRK